MCCFVSVWVYACVFVFMLFGKIDYDIKKQQFLGEENIFSCSSTLVQYIIIYVFLLYFAQFSSEYKSSQTLHWFCDSFSSPSLFGKSCCSTRSRWEGRLSRCSFVFLSFFIWKLLLSFFCVWIYVSLILSFAFATTKIDYMKYFFVFVLLSH